MFQSRGKTCRAVAGGDDHADGGARRVHGPQVPGQPATMRCATGYAGLGAPTYGVICVMPEPVNVIYVMLDTAVPRVRC
ncbi:hypothetical protein GCM10017744_099810 [Streptomyces antimycoticus]|uniref:Uncharacterized protein n=1 Tax=Streptomyces antimycoticus TaxID=68175 RepID=A0A4D4K1Y7_9ACTN|nr:hypothetical protein SANT12839_012210 [Streptomyces antimycoticus]